MADGYTGIKNGQRLYILSMTIAIVFYVGNFCLNCKDCRAEDASIGVEDYISFASPGEIRSRYQKYGPKEWKDEERLQLKSVVRELLAEHRGLFQLATSSEKIRLFRVGAIVDQESCNSSPYNVVLRTHDTEILVTDTYFSSPEMAKNAILHELVHVADSGGFLAYSKEFILFVANAVNGERALEQMVSPAESERISAQLRISPNLFCLRNQNEALAYFFVDVVDGKNYQIPSIVLQSLRKPTAFSLSKRKHFSCGISKLERAQDTEGAISEFLQVEMMDPITPAPAINLGRCFSKLGKTKQSVDSYKRAIKKFCATGCSSLEPELVLTKYRLSLELIKLGAFTEAKQLLEEFIPQAPNVPLRNFAQSKLDLCNSKSP